MEHVTFVDGQVTHTKSQENNSYNTNSGSHIASSGVASARNADYGYSQQGASVSDDSIVKIGGIEMKVKDAVRAGVIVRNADGALTDNYKTSDNSAAVQQAQAKPRNALEIEPTRTPQQKQAVEAVNNVPVNARLPDEIEQSFQEFQAGLPASVVQAAMGTLATAGELSETTISDLASRLHVEPHQLAARIEPIHSALAEQAGIEIAAYGLDPVSVRDWATENAPGLMKEATFEHLNLRSTKGYQAVAQAYLQQLDKIDPEALLNAELGSGISVTQGERGEIILNTPSGKMTWGSAIRAGLVNISAMRG